MATPYYVSKAGSDLNDGLTWETAKLTIQNALNLAISGDTVWIRSGTYVENLDIHAGITVCSETGLPADVIIDGGGINRVAYLVNVSSWLIGCTITNGYLTSTAEGSGVYGGSVLNCIITNNIGHFGGGGLKSSIVYNSIISENEVIMNEGGGGRNCTFYNCLLVNNYAYSGGAGYTCELYNCTIVNNTATVGGGVAYSNVYNSVSWGNSTIDQFVGGSNQYSCGIGYAGLNSIDTDPLLVDYGSGNYRLSSISPCIDVGFNYSWMTDPADARSKDLDGNPRIWNSIADMGTYESEWFEYSSSSISSSSISSVSSSSVSSMSSSSISSSSMSSSSISSSSMSSVSSVSSVSSSSISSSQSSQSSSTYLRTSSSSSSSLIERKLMAIKVLKTKKHDSAEPIMVIDNNANAHCVWQNDGLYCYSKFNGIDWEYLNDYKVIDSVPLNAVVPKNGMCADSSGNPYVLWAKSSYKNIFGQLSYLYLTCWNNYQWKKIERKILLEVLYGSSLVFFDENLYIGSLIFKDDKYLFAMSMYQNDAFVQLNTYEISALSRESKVLLKRVENYIYCFWECFDSNNYWIEHIIYDIATNSFNSTFTRKINFSNDNIPISGFDFMYLDLYSSSSSQSSESSSSQSS